MKILTFLTSEIFALQQQQPDRKHFMATDFAYPGPAKAQIDKFTVTLYFSPKVDIRKK